MIAESAAQAPSLGITANIAAAPGVPGAKTEAVRAAEEDAAARSPEAAKARRWKLQRVAQGLLRQERVAHCQRSVSSDVGVSVYRTGDGAHFAGVVTCGSVWHCPVCAAKITEGRREELQHATTEHARHGGAVYLITYTFRHHEGEDLGENVKAFSEALRKLKATRAYKRAMEDAGAIGTVRALEVTHGENGWHPHVHELVFADEGAIEALEAIRPLWTKAVRKVGLSAALEHGFDVRGGDYAAEYVAKFGHEPGEERGWSAAREVAKAASKRARGPKGMTPFALLEAAGAGDHKAAVLFQEYALVFKGRRQLFWSPGLKDRLKVQEATDAELAERVQEDPELVAVVSLEDWRHVLRHDARFELLQVAARYGERGVHAFLARIRGAPGTHRGSYHLQGHFGGGLRELYA
ncbi:MAG TPA: hypothetical protein ENJ79_07790 [Gammaproteobacteria bacterium]|nr:hypothetical protein [Gammaproteobacteria bacterium]